jgi:hypothetical protein
MGIEFMSTTVRAVEWKPQDTTGDHTQFGLPGVVGAVSKMQELEPWFIARADFNGVLCAAARHSGMDDLRLSEAIHVSAGYMSKFMRGVAQQWAHRLVLFMRSTRSLAPLQWIANEMGCDITVRSAAAAEKAQLLARLRELEKGAAA